MSMRKMLTLLLCLMALASVFISCAAEQQTDDLATVRLSINSERSRTINEEGNKVVKYRFVFVPKEGAPYTFEENKSDTGVYTMKGIKAGTYTLNSYALNSAGNVVAENTQNKDIERGTNTITVLFENYKAQNNGSISINVKWNKGAFSDSDMVQISGTIKPLKGTSDNIEFPKTIDSNNGNISTVIENLLVGSYHISIVGKQGTKSVFGINEVVVVSPNATTVVNFDFTGLTTSTTITVVDNLVLPLKGTLTATDSDVHPFFNLSLSIDPTAIPASIYKDSEGNTKDITIEWYAEDFMYSTTKVQYKPNETISSDISISAIYGPAYYTTVFYIDGVVDSLGSARIKVNYDSSTKTITVLPITDQS